MVSMHLMDRMPNEHCQREEMRQKEGIGHSPAAHRRAAPSLCLWELSSSYQSPTLADSFTDRLIPFFPRVFLLRRL